VSWGSTGGTPVGVGRDTEGRGTGAPPLFDPDDTNYTGTIGDIRSTFVRLFKIISKVNKKI